MSYFKVEGENANYIIVLSSYHNSDNQQIERLLQECDAVVLEANPLSNIDYLKKYNTLFREIENSKSSLGELITQLEQNHQEKRIYTTDVTANLNIDDYVFFLKLVTTLGLTISLPKDIFRAINRREFLKGLGTLGLKAITIELLITPLAHLYLSNNNSDNELAKMAREYISKHEEIYSPFKSAILRDAINTLKLEQFVAPRVKSELGKKPTLLLFEFSTTHTNIVDFLRKPSLAEVVLQRFKPELYQHLAEFGNPKFNDVPGLESSIDELDRIGEFKFDPKNGWKKQIHHYDEMYKKIESHIIAPKKVEPIKKIEGPKQNKETSRRDFLRRIMGHKPI